MWAKVVESGADGNRGGQIWQIERRQWNLWLNPPKTAQMNRKPMAFSPLLSPSWLRQLLLPKDTAPY